MEQLQGDTSGHEFVTIPELARLVRRNRKTVYNWIADGEIGEADGLFVVLGRMLIHWPTLAYVPSQAVQAAREIARATAGLR